jgi:hypothetical protein
VTELGAEVLAALIANPAAELPVRVAAVKSLAETDRGRASRTAAESSRASVDPALAALEDALAAEDEADGTAHRKLVRST